MYAEIQEFLSEIFQYRLLRPEEEPRLFRRIERGLSVYKRLKNLNDIKLDDEAALVDLVAAYEVVHNTNMRLVASVAFKYTRSFNGEALLDYVQVGSEGLEQAIHLFDYRRGFKFSTYAMNWIKQAIRRDIANNSRTIRLPVHEHDKWVKVINAENQLWLQLQRQPTPEDIAEATGFSAEKVAELLRTGRRELKSLNEPVDESGESEFGDFIPQKEESVDKVVARGLDNENTMRHIFSSKQLSEQEKVILSLRFGIYAPELEEFPINSTYGSYKAIADEAVAKGGMEKKYIGYALGIKREEIGKIEERALEKLIQDQDLRTQVS